MKLLVLLCVAAVYSQEAYHQTEDDRYDTTSQSLAELRSVAQCLNDRGPCNKVTASFRQHYPAVIQEACRRCSKDHKISLCQFYKRIMKELPEEVKAVKQRHDPNGIYFDKFYASFSNEC